MQPPSYTTLSWLPGRQFSNRKEEAGGLKQCYLKILNMNTVLQYHLSKGHAQFGMLRQFIISKPPQTHRPNIELHGIPRSTWNEGSLGSL